MPNAKQIGPVRSLNADDLDLGYAAAAQTNPGSSAPNAPHLSATDPFVARISELLTQFGGVILSGPPGTSKSFYAGQVANAISEGDSDRMAFVQFHASYQFEDFMEGYRPDSNAGGFVLRPGVFLRMVEKAAVDPSRSYVLVIDELSRADVGRVFGEALTYIEKSKRFLPFTLPSGSTCAIPGNLLLIMTMNPLDRGVDEVDAAFERRFAKVAMDPSADRLEDILASSSLTEPSKRRLVAWFRNVNGRAKSNPAAAVGHAYFSDVVDLESLAAVWEYQLKYLVDRAFQYDQESRDAVVKGWSGIWAGEPPSEETADDSQEESVETHEGA